jgi:hypothetical protein
MEYRKIGDNYYMGFQIKTKEGKYMVNYGLKNIFLAELR